MLNNNMSKEYNITRPIAFDVNKYSYTMLSFMQHRLIFIAGTIPLDGLVTSD